MRRWLGIGLALLGWAWGAAAGEAAFPGLRPGDWARYGLERDDGTVREDAGIFLTVTGVDDEQLSLTMVHKEAPDAAEAERQLRAEGGRDVYPEITTPDAVRIAAAAVRDPTDLTEMEKIGMPEAWARSYLAWVAKAKPQAVGENPNQEELDDFAPFAAKTLAETIAPRREDTQWHIDWKTAENEFEVALDRAAPDLAPLLLVTNVVEAGNADIAEAVDAATDETVRVGGRDVACHRRVFDARVVRQGMRTDYHAESWLADGIPWLVARCRLVVTDLPDETPRVERYTLRLRTYGDIGSRPEAPYFPTAKPRVADKPAAAP